MGLRTASLRRPYVAVMAPALTETTQPQALKLPPKVDHHVQPASPLNGFEARGKFLPDVHGSTCFQEVDGAAGAPAVVASGANMNEEQAPQDDIVAAAAAAAAAAVTAAPTPPSSAPDTDNNTTDNNTGNNNIALAMGQDEKNQQQQGALDVADFPQNVDELMQVIKSIENAAAAVPGTDLIDELPAGLDNLLAGVDMMDMSIEEDTKDDVKEDQTKDLIVDLEKRQARLERRLDLMRRKVHKLQVRHMGQHASGEVAGVFEYVHRSLKRLKDNESDQQQQHTLALPPPLSEDEQAAVGGGGGGDNRPRPMSQGSAKAMVKKLEMTAMWQANAAARQKHVSRYFGAGSLEPGRCGTVPGVISVPPWPTEHKQELYRVTGLLKTELGVVQREVDSEATDSSSGGESCDEMVNYNNPHQQYLSIQKRALWKFLTARAAIAAKWSWLQAQITDLEYRIRTYTDFHRQIRTAKGTVTLGGASPPRCNGDSSSTIGGVGDGNTLYTAASPTATINGYRGQLPGSNSTFSNKSDIGVGGTPSLETSANGVCIDYQCARTRPLVNFRKRKLLQTNGLHLVSKKAARPSTVRCGCVPSAVPCALCTGRTDPTHPRDPTDALSKAERIALVDPTFHPVFSLHEDVSCGIHCDAIMKMPEWQQRSTRMKSMKSLKGGVERSDKSMLDHRSKALDHRKKYGRLKPSTASALSAKIKNKMRGRKPTNRHSSASLYRINRKRSSAKTIATQMQALVTDGADEEVESIGNSSLAATNSALASPSCSPLFHLQTISGYNRRNRANSYDIDNIVIPYSVAASTRVEKLQYKEILTPKWRIADTDFKCDTKNNGAVRNPSQDSEELLQTEDLSEEAVVLRHDRSEYEEKKKFQSYLKLPAGHARSRAHKRTDSLAESSGANTPDAMSPHPVDAVQDSAGSPMASPPATPLPAGAATIAEEPSVSTAVPAALPSVAVMRRRTVSQSRPMRDREATRDEVTTPVEHFFVEAVLPFDTRTFPLDEGLYSKMMESMPENSQLKTNDRARDSISDYALSYLDDKAADSPCSESTESAIGEEDPNDPEWVDMERSRDRHKR